MGKPKIRFKGYTEDWEQRKLGDYVEIISGEAPAKFQSGDINYVKVDDLNYSYKTVINTQNKVLKNSSAKMVQAGSVIFPKRGAAILTNKVRVLGVDSYMDTNMMALSSEKLDTNFLYTMLSKEGLYKIADTSTIPQINNKHIEPYKICLPKTKEQQKIGEYFSNLDHLITLHQRKCDETKKLKKCMLQKMFPKDGEKVPEIRFSGFTGDWKQRKLGEIIEVCSGRDYKHLEKGNIPVYGTGGYMISVSKALSYDKDAVGIGRKGTIDKPYILKAPFWTVDTLFYCVSKEDCDLSFIFDVFQNINWKALDESTGVPSLSKTVINNVKVLIPSVIEQIKIGKYFSLLDNHITFHQQKCDELKDIKKFMLQNMFISEK